MIFLDTDIVIAHERGDPSATAAMKRFAQEGETLATTSINVAELFHGAERAARRDDALGSVLLVLDSLAQVPFGPAAARRFGAVMASLHKAGHPIPVVDGLIAAIVLENGARLATRNRRHFERVHGLQLLDA